MSDLIFSTSMLFDTKVEKGCLKQTECSKFYIAPYQRGYKWGNEPIELLFDDLYDAFNTSKDSKKSEEYYLQYITVKKVNIDNDNDTKNNYLEIIDGQQRVTTLTILYSTLNEIDIVKNKLKYAVRDNVQKYINEKIYENSELPDGWDDLIKENPIYNEQDIFYMFNAQKIFNDKIEKKLKSTKDDFTKYLKNNIKIIVNVVEPHISSEQVFSNLNNNKVALTNADLVKGLFLTKLARDNEDTPSFKEILEKRASIGRQWDEMENWINKEEIKAYYFPKESNSMEGFLRLFLKFSTNEEVILDKATDYVIYNKLDKYMKTNNSVSDVFHKFRLLYASLVEWYDDVTIYNLLGFVLHSKESEFSIMNLFEDKDILLNKKVLIEKLCDERNKILSKISDDFDILSYEDDKKDIQNILLALSIFANQNEENNNNSVAFNFYRYKKEKWSLEHIFPQNPPRKKESFILTSDDIKNINTLTQDSNGKYPNLIEDDFENIEEFRNKYEQLINKLQAKEEFTIQKDEILILDKMLLKSKNLLHSIGNMALLSSADNSSMSNNMFQAKRLNLSNRVSKGSFIPKHTFDVFSKLIEQTKDDSGEILEMNSDLKMWTNQDIKAHQNWIKQQYNKIIGENK